MRKIFLILILAIGLSAVTNAQKYAYIDSKYILENIPEYTQAQKKLDDLSEKWQKEIEEKYAEIEKLYKAYQADQILLPEDMKRKREDEIVRKEREAKEFQKQKFGVNGELFQKRQELIKPIQDKIYKAVKNMAEESNYVFVFDKANQSNIMYASPKLNKSDLILKKMGYKPGSR